MTGDMGFSDIRNYPPAQYAGFVILRIPKDATASFILNLLRGLLKQGELVSALRGNLAIVEPERIRIRKA